MGEAFDRTLDAEAAVPAGGAQRHPEPHFIVALECDRIAAGSSRHRLGGGGTVVVGRGPERKFTRAGDYRATGLDLRVPDPRMSALHARLDGALGQWTIRDTGSRNGVRVNGEPVRERLLFDGDLVELGHTLFLYVEEVPGVWSEDFDPALTEPITPGFATLIPSLHENFSKLARLSTTAVPALILGETGTGKEVAARALHALSGRPGKFVGVNCGAIPESLLESELFGSTRGAFSGSIADRPGLVRSADRGTLFLDEIGDLPLASQAAFLRVLEERRVRPVGGTDAVAVDLRIVAATNQDVEQLVREGKFRDDLFARIAGFRMTLPPLRERRADLGLLIAALLGRISGADSTKVSLGVEAARAFFEYRFPLNVRELENWLTTAVALAGDGPIRPEHLPDPVDLGQDEEPSPESERKSNRPLSVEQAAHKEEVESLLRAHRGNVSAVARAAGKARNQVQRWLKRYALDPENYR